MNQKRLWQVAIDTGGRGVELIELLIELNLVQDRQSAKELMKKGDIAVNRVVIKDVLYRLLAGSHIVSLCKAPQVRVTII